MSRRSRQEQRLLDEQNTVQMSRAERKEQEELTGKRKVEAARAKALKLAHEKIAEAVRPARVARPGKPLKR